VRIAKIALKQELRRQNGTAHEAGTVDVMAFGLRSSDYDSLMETMNFIAHRAGWTAR
jgi:hypothetical protein